MAEQKDSNSANYSETRRPLSLEVSRSKWDLQVRVKVALGRPKLKTDPENLR
jgi:hypothetical protein